MDDNENVKTIKYWTWSQLMEDPDRQIEDYPDEDLWEDGELNNMQVGLKLLQLWQRGDIMIVRKTERIK